MISDESRLISHFTRALLSRFVIARECPGYRISVLSSMPLSSYRALRLLAFRDKRCDFATPFLSRFLNSRFISPRLLRHRYRMLDNAIFSSPTFNIASLVSSLLVLRGFLSSFHFADDMQISAPPLFGQSRPQWRRLHLAMIYGRRETIPAVATATAETSRIWVAAPK